MRVGFWSRTVSVLIRRDTRKFILLSPCSYMRTQQWRSHILVRKRVLTRNCMWWKLDLGIPASRIWRILLSAVLSHLVKGILLWQPKYTNTSSLIRSHISLNIFFLFFFFFLPYWVLVAGCRLPWAYGTLVLQTEIKTTYTALAGGFLTTGPPGNSSSSKHLWSKVSYFWDLVVQGTM